MEITLKNMKKELDANNMFGVELRNFKDSMHNIENLVSDLDEYLCLVNNNLLKIESDLEANIEADLSTINIGRKINNLIELAIRKKRTLNIDDVMELTGLTHNELRKLWKDKMLNPFSPIIKDVEKIENFKHLFFDTEEVFSLYDKFYKNKNLRKEYQEYLINEEFKSFNLETQNRIEKFLLNLNL